MTNIICNVLLMELTLRINRGKGLSKVFQFKIEKVLK